MFSNLFSIRSNSARKKKKTVENGRKRSVANTNKSEKIADQSAYSADRERRSAIDIIRLKIWNMVEIVPSRRHLKSLEKSRKLQPILSDTIRDD